MEDDTKKGSSQLLSLVVILSGILPLNLGMLPSLCSPAHLSTASLHVFLADSPNRNSKHTAHKTLFPQRWSLWKRPSAFSEHFKISIYFLQKLETHFKIFLWISSFRTPWKLNEVLQKKTFNWTKTHLSRRWRQAWEHWRSSAARSSELPAPSNSPLDSIKNELLCASLTPVCTLHS